MVATVGSIAVDLSANTAKFIAGFQKSATTVERESKRMSNAISGFSKKASGIGSAFVGGIVAGGTLAAIGSLTGAISGARQALSDFEEIGNRAKATGLSTDTFQAISHGASLADVEQESLNKSLEIFAKNAGLAKEGTGALYSGLIKLNPQLLQSVLHATSQEERLKLVADAMAKMTDATDKAALATVVFGRGGAEMVRVLDKGSESIEKMKRDAQDLGIIIPEELIKRSGELDDKLSTLGKVIDVNISQALVKAAPLLVAGAEGMVKLAQGLNEASTAIGAFANNPSLAEFLKLMQNKEIFSLEIGGVDVVDKLSNIPKQMNEADLIRTLERQKAKVAELNEAWTEYLEIRESANDPARAGLVELETADALAKVNELRAELDELNAHAKGIEVTMDTSQARAAIDQLRSSDLAALWAEAADKPTDSNLPTVHYRDDQGPDGTDEEVKAAIERAADRDEAERKAAADEIARKATADHAATRAAIIALDSNTAGYFGELGSQIEGGLRALSYSVAANSGYATGSAAGSFKYSGNNSSGSWAGKQMTFGGNSEADTAYYDSVFGGRANSVGGTEDASSITDAGTTSGAINVNIVVKPVMEGSRLSGQSSAEIKQAASAGANAALRAYYGR